MTADFRKIDCNEVKLGMRFSAPVFFEDGKNMFLASGKEAKPYHIFAIQRWKIPFLLTSGTVMPSESVPNISSEGIEAEVNDLPELDGIEAELEPLD